MPNSGGLLPIQVFMMMGCSIDHSLAEALSETCMAQCVERMALQAAPGVTGPTTPPRRCARSRTSSEFKTQLDSGIPQDQSVELVSCAVVPACGI